MGFLHHLAGLALGTMPASAARPSLPSRFAASPFTSASQGLQVIEPVTPTEPVVRGPQPRAMPPASFERKETASPAAPRLQHPPPAAPPAVASRPVRQEGGPPPPPPAPSIATVVEHRPSPETSSAVIGESPERSQSAPAAPRPMAAHTDIDIQVVPEPRVTRAAPLSPAVVAGRAMAAREQPPVIHVTIDRLDVRAPARAEPARQRPRPQPTVSLSDYLRDGSSGGRR